MTTDGDGTDRTARDALAWYVRLKDPMATPADRAAFGVWLAAAPEHRRAFAEAEALWARVAAPAARLGAGGWYRRPAPPPARRRVLPALAAAAAVLLLAVGALWRDPGLVDRALADYATAPGERRESVLVDGSRLVLDADSAVSVSLDDAQRTVVLRRGRVWVDVVHDSRRGFRVVAGDVAARVLGTAFDVERQGGGVTVTVERGTVAVAADGRPEGGVVLSAGQRTRVVAGQASAPQPVAADTASAWRRGLVVFDRAPLGEVAAALDRLSGGRVLVAGGDLQGMALSGVFRADDPDAVLDALRSALGVRTTTVPGIATVIHR
ncbi:FecR family protein [Azospirillum sp. ST 5-10]|uniref:FecR family protein n=1 Tax=unclassified Azospirillum TaxID=2630922 RepID=UPI003F4A50D7